MGWESVSTVLTPWILAEAQTIQAIGVVDQSIDLILGSIISTGTPQTGEHPPAASIRFLNHAVSMPGALQSTDHHSFAMKRYMR